MLLKKHGKREERRMMTISYRPKINLKENKRKIQKIRDRIIADANSSLVHVPLRPSGRYALNKLKLMRKYIWAYSVIISKNFPSFFYLETHSGPGLCKIRGTTKIECGTPILALSNIPNFTKYRFIENNQSCKKSLERLIDNYFPDYDAQVLQKDCNKSIETPLSDFTKNSPILSIIDPEGTEIHWKTLETLSKYKTDIVMMFPYDLAIKRCIAPSCDSKAQESITRMYGTDEWKKIRDEYYVHKKIKYSLMRKRFVELYKNRLQEVLNFSHVVVSKMIKGDNNQPLYYLIVAGREQVAEIIGKDIFDVKTEQATLKLS